MDIIDGHLVNSSKNKMLFSHIVQCAHFSHQFGKRCMKWMGIAPDEKSVSINWKLVERSVYDHNEDSLLDDERGSN